jgi:hypothetical protein
MISIEAKEVYEFINNRRQGWEPINSAYIQFARLEYFSIKQQEDYQTDYEPANDIAYIEAIVFYWMKDNGLNKLGELHKMSRCLADEVPYHVKKS